jgi:hypothetical protein
MLVIVLILIIAVVLLISMDRVSGRQTFDGCSRKAAGAGLHASNWCRLSFVSWRPLRSWPCSIFEQAECVEGACLPASLLKLRSCNVFKTFLNDVCHDLVPRNYCRHTQLPQ